jgi:hypothetical protein
MLYEETGRVRTLTVKETLKVLGISLRTGQNRLATIELMFSTPEN